MEYRRLGKTGLKVSVFSLGTWITVKKDTDPNLVTDIISRAIELGVNTLDTAEAYAAGEAETQLGNILKNGKWDRTDLVIITKIFFGTKKGPNATGLSFKHIVEGLDASLARLQLKYVDVVFCHRPDPDVPIEETVRAMNHVINQGKAFYWGTSEWSASQISEAYGVARELNLTPPVVEQPQYSMLVREKVENEYLNLYPPGNVGLGTTVWSPLNYGILTGKYNEGIPAGSRLENEPFFKESKEKLSKDEGKQKIEKVKQLTVIAQEIGASMTQLALAWAAKNKNVSTVILGATSVQQVEENVAALQFVAKITPEIEERIEAILANKPTPPRKLR